MLSSEYITNSNLGMRQVTLLPFPTYASAISAAVLLTCRLLRKGVKAFGLGGNTLAGMMAARPIAHCQSCAVI
jgi:hypothetical protein